VVGPTGRPARPRPTILLPPRSNGKPEAATAVYKLLMMGKRMTETCWAVFERRAINLRDWCTWLVDLFVWVTKYCSIYACVKAMLLYAKWGLVSWSPEFGTRSKIVYVDYRPSRFFHDRIIPLLIHSRSLRNSSHFIVHNNSPFWSSYNVHKAVLPRLVYCTICQ
jgi:hypothetical protein